MIVGIGLSLEEHIDIKTLVSKIEIQAKNDFRRCSVVESELIRCIDFSISIEVNNLGISNLCITEVRV